MPRTPLPRPRLAGWIMLAVIYLLGFFIGRETNSMIEERIERDCTTAGVTMINGEQRACAFVTRSAT